MTFDEAIKYAKENSFVEEMLSDVVELEDVIEILEKIKKEYAPTVEMTKNDRDILLHNLENYPFDVFIVSISMSDKEIFGLPANKEFKGLSIEDLMQAWLHPETIKVVDE